ncbi:hypothetical protein [Nonomuraea longicatena]
MLIRAMSSVACALFVLAACGTSTTGGAAPSTPPSASATTENKTSAENKAAAVQAAKADCMKGKGFKYIPYVPPEKKKTAMEVKLESGDYAAMKAHREKYGFGIFSEYIYPGEIGLSVATAEREKNPNSKITDSLSSAQHDQYNKADLACTAKAVKQVLDKDIDRPMDYYNQRASLRDTLVGQEINSDPELLRLANSMADCLKAKGYPVTNTKPSEVKDVGELQVTKELARLGRAQGEKDAKTFAKREGLAPFPMPRLTADQARPHLAQEVKHAMANLDCGKDFYAAYTPKMTDLTVRLDAEYVLF